MTTPPEAYLVGLGLILVFGACVYGTHGLIALYKKLTRK